MDNKKQLIQRTFSMPRGQEFQDLISFCKVMADSPFYKKLGPGGVMSIVLTAKELNLPMMPCLNGGMYNIEGCVTLSAQLMNAMLIMQGHKISMLSLDETGCTIQFQRSNSKVTNKYSYTYEDAKKAGYLNKNNWKNHLKDMLYCRALSGGARKFMPDALMGCYIHGEIITPDVQILPEEVNRPVPDLSTSQIKDEKKVEPESLDFVKADGFDAFTKEHDLLGKSKKADYILEIAETSEKTPEEIINFAVSNQERFYSGFEKWDNTGKPKKDQVKADPKEETSQ